MADMKCLDCVGEMLYWMKNHPAGQVEENDPVPQPADAVTLAPSWQMKTVMGQQIMACVAVPACYRHLGVEKASALDQAVMGGKLLHGLAN